MRLKNYNFFCNLNNFYIFLCAKMFIYISDIVNRQILRLRGIVDLILVQFLNYLPRTFLNIYCLRSLNNEKITDK